MENSKVPRRKSIKLTTPLEIRKALSRVANMVLNGDIDSKSANSIILACNAILGGIKTMEHEKKLKELEELLLTMNKGETYET